MPVFSYPALFTTAPTVDPVMLLILGILMDALAGGARVTRAVPGPTRFFDRMVKYLEPKLNRSRRTTGTRLVRGLLLVVFVAVVAAIAGLGFLILARWLPGSWIIEVALIAALLGQGTVSLVCLWGARPEAKDDRVFAGVSNIPWIGAKDGRARANEADVRRALFLYGIAGLLVMATALFAAVIFAA